MRIRARLVLKLLSAMALYPLRKFGKGFRHEAELRIDNLCNADQHTVMSTLEPSTDRDYFTVEDAITLGEIAENGNSELAWQRSR